jgi:hypothetical protein
MDKSYRVVATVTAAGIGAPIDMHEFTLIASGETALVTIYQPTLYEFNTRELGATGWVFDCIFQEIDLANNELIFEWRSLNHISPALTALELNVTEHRTSEKPFDYFHLNSVDKTEEGDYIISARHTSSIYKVSGANGSVLWQLNGRVETSDFDLVDVSFSWQHDARVLHENDTECLISIFDNARTQDIIDSPMSSAKIIRLDYLSRTATLQVLVESASSNSESLSSISQGNVQALEDGNLLVGWGSEPYISEHSPNGTMVWQASWEDQPSANYRAYKGLWHGQPDNTRPAVWSYSKTKKSRTVIYVSWNGATEVQSWNVYGASDPQFSFSGSTFKSNTSAITKILSENPKKGFETQVWLEDHRPYVMVGAVNKHGEEMKNSTLMKTFVPSAGIAMSCGDEHCLPVEDMPDGTKQPSNFVIWPQDSSQISLEILSLWCVGIALALWVLRNLLNRKAAFTRARNKP